MNVASMVIGIVAIFMACIPLIGVLAIIPALVGLVMGGIALAKKKGGKGMAVSGVVTNVIAIVLAIIVMAAVKSCADKVGEGLEDLAAPRLNTTSNATIEQSTQAIIAKMTPKEMIKFMDAVQTIQVAGQTYRMNQKTAKEIMAMAEEIKSKSSNR